MLRPLVILLLAVFAAASIAAPSARAERRLALVIGNDQYQNITPLKKAVNDATSLGKALENLGFSVTRATDLARRDMNRLLSEFIASVNKGDTAMFFYAGHGVEIDGKNYLLPVDVPKGSSADSSFIGSESVAVDDVLAKLKSRDAQLNLIVLDACRNDPFASSSTRGLGSGKGLARISAPQGTFVMYSADVGEAALDRLGDDDNNPNSVFTRTLLPLMAEPGRDLVDTAREVRRRVRDLALTVRHQQTPAYYDAVLGDFFFTSGNGGAAPEKVEPEKVEPQKQAALPEVKEEPVKRETVPEVKLAPLGRALIVTGGEKDSIRLWDPDARKLIGELEGEKIVISALKITGGGRTLAVAGTDGSLFSYAIPEFKKKNALYPGFRVTGIAEARDGALVLGGQDGTMAVIEPGDFKVRWRARNHGGIVNPVLVSGDGKRVVTASEDGTIAETDLATGTVLGRVRSAPGKEITDIAYLSPAVVVAVHEDGTIAHINIATGRVLAAFKGNKGWISSVEVLGGGQYVTAGVDGTLAFWALGANSPVRQLRAHTDVAAGAKALTADSGNMLVSAGFDGSLKLWTEGAGRLLADLPHGSAILFFDQVSASH